MEETPDMSKILELVNILKNADSSSNNQENGKNNVPNNFEMPDVETIMKINQIIKAMNSSSNTASANLLYSLKPFLRKTKQDKIDQYVNMLKLSSVISEFNKNDKNLF